MVKRKKQASVVINNHNTVKISNPKPRRRRAAGVKKKSFNTLGGFGGGGGGGATFIPLVEQQPKADLNPIFHNLTHQSQQIAHLQQQQALLTNGIKLHYVDDDVALLGSRTLPPSGESMLGNNTNTGARGYGVTEPQSTAFSERASPSLTYKPTGITQFEHEDTRPPPQQSVPPRNVKTVKPGSFHQPLPVGNPMRAKKPTTLFDSVTGK